MTGVELFLPIVIAYLLCAEGGQYLGHRSTHHNATIEPVQNVTDFMNQADYQFLVYTPTIQFTDKLIEKVSEFLC